MIPDARERAWSRTLHAAGLTAALAAAAALAASVSLPLRSREETLERQLADAWAILGDAERITGEHAAAKATLQSAEDRIRRLREQIPDTAQEAQFKEQLGRLAEEVGFEIIDYRPGTPEPHDFCEQIRVQVTGRASYEILCRFLNGIDRLPRVCRTVGLGIDTKRAKGGAYDVELTLSIFFGVRPEALDAAREKQNG